MDYRTDPTYQALEKIIQDAGVKITYETVPDDSIDGEIWARSDIDTDSIMMPEAGDAFPDAETACVILGHEMGHILSRLDSPDDPAQRRQNEAVCDLIGVYLFRLAGMIYEKQAEDSFRAYGEQMN